MDIYIVFDFSNFTGAGYKDIGAAANHIGVHWATLSRGIESKGYYFSHFKIGISAKLHKSNRGNKPGSSNF